MFQTKLPFLLAFLLSTPTLAAIDDPNLMQLKARQVSTPGFWAAFTSLLRGEKTETADLTVKVLDESGRPLKGATVLVGQKKGEPFADNQAVTDETGNAAFADEKLRLGAALTVTATKSGYSSLSIISNKTNSIELGLTKFKAERDYGFLSGKVNGFPPGHGRGELEFGLFVPAFRPEALMNFDPQQFVSSYKVEIDVFGKREVPGNLVLPPQSKWYGIVPISLSKPEFLMPLSLGTKSYMSAVVGAVGISDAMDAIKQKDFLKALNLAYFTHVGWTTRRVNVDGNEKFDVNATQEVSAKASAAKFAGVGAKLDLVALSLFDPAGDQGDFVALDVKGLKSEEIKNGAGKIKLGLLKQRKTKDDFYLFAALFDRAQLADKNSTSRSIVGSLQKLDHNADEPVSQFKAFLRPIKSNGVKSSNREYRFTSSAASGISPDFVLVNIVSEKKNEFTMGTTRNVIWSSVIPGDAESLSLPDLGKPVLPTPDASKEEKFLWEVIAVKSGSAQRAELDVQSALRDLQHVSSLSQKF